MTVKLTTQEIEKAVKCYLISHGIKVDQKSACWWQDQEGYPFDKDDIYLGVTTVELPPAMGPYR